MLVEGCKSQLVGGCDCGVEDGLRSHIWVKNPLKGIHLEADGRTCLADACRIGLCNDKKPPWLKTYRFETNVPFQHSRKKCCGHGMLDLAKLEGGSNTARTAVYTHKLCCAIIAYVCAFFC